MILGARIAVMVVAVSMPLFAHAQFITPTITNSFSLSLSPQYPPPHSTTILSLTSSNIDLPSSIMTVSVNGSSVYSGNVKSVPISIGAPGQATTIKVDLSVGSKSYTQTLVIRPADVAFIQEPVSSAPPLYAGKPLLPSSGTVRIVAVADFKDASGKQINPASLSYTWTENDTTLQSSSGIGKNAIIVKAPLQYRNNKVSVVVRSMEGGLVGGANTAIVTSSPTVRLYVNDPLMGIRYDRALPPSYSIPGSEISLVGVPYSFAINRGLPTMSWFLNGTRAQTGSTITLRPEGQGQGKASLSFTATSANSNLETVTAPLSLTFGTAQASGLFGL